MSNLIVAGSRDLIHNQHCVVVANAIQQWISEHGPVTRVLCGDCRGADTFGRHWAETVGVSVPALSARLGPVRKSGGAVPEPGHGTRR
jgi:hypothetical protein